MNTTFTVFSVTGEARWTRTTRDGVADFGASYVRVTRVTGAMYNDDITVSAGITSVANAAVIV